MGLCEGCLSQTTCKKELLRLYKLPDGSQYEACRTVRKSRKI